jgi:hypothetical protein
VAKTCRDACSNNGCKQRCASDQTTCHTGCSTTCRSCVGDCSGGTCR